MFQNYGFGLSGRAVRQGCSFGKDPDLLRLAGISFQHQPWHSLPVSCYFHCLCPAINRPPVEAGLVYELKTTHAELSHMHPRIANSA